MSCEDRLLDHSYDGIQEFDNPLPGWWKWLFWGSIAYSFVYVLFFHVGIGPSVYDDFDNARAAYFEAFPGVWRHGDWAELTERGGIVVHGRSDATLNPGGIRIGTAEIYRQVEQLDAVVESLVIGQEHGGDTRIVLFVRLGDGTVLDDALAERLRRQIRAGASPHHVPELVFQVDDLPRTLNGKISEIAVREVVHGRPVKNRDALANPEALDLFERLPGLRD